MLLFRGGGHSVRLWQTTVLDASTQTHMREPGKHSPRCPYLMLRRLLPPLPVKEVAQFSKLALKTAPSCSELLIASL